MERRVKKGGFKITSLGRLASLSPWGSTKHLTSLPILRKTRFWASAVSGLTEAWSVSGFGLGRKQRVFDFVAVQGLP